MKKILLLLVKFYQRKISPLKTPCCKYYPSCSAYALTAIEKHGALKGTALAVWRVLRCNPWSLGGVDEVPDRFCFYTLSKRYGRGRTVPPDCEGSLTVENSERSENQAN
ncbi:MAG: membrane protein insertion efficiency factor YidD [Ruminococcus sp.]|nr:membrane protein insertion efficiency factor YidD [Ruminococcus sp.]